MKGLRMSELWDARELRATRDFLAKMDYDTLYVMAMGLYHEWAVAKQVPDEALGDSYRTACCLADALHDIQKGNAEEAGLCPQCNGFGKTINGEGLLQMCDECNEDGKPIPITEEERSYLVQVTHSSKRWYHDNGWWRSNDGTQRKP